MKAAVTLIVVILTCMVPSLAVAQTTRFTYQGQLTDSGSPQATYQMRFRLFDAVASGSQVGSTIENAAVAVSDGIFTVALDFGAPVFSGADRFLEIAVRRNGGESYTVLSPRQQIASSPYAIRTLSAQTADVALDANKLGGVDASEYVTNGEVGGSFINNGTTVQAADFNIDGDGFVGGTLGVGTSVIDPNFRFDVLGTGRVLNPSAAHLVAQTTGGTNSWARFYMRSPNRSWFIGTSQNFNGDQFYLVDETGGQSRMTIQPSGGAIAFPLGNVGIGTGSPGARLAVSTNTNSSGNNTAYFEAPTIGPNASNIHFGTTGDWYVRSASANGKVVLQDTGGNIGIGTASPNSKLSLVGNAAQDLNSGGFPKALVFVNGDGSIIRCYNGTNGSTSSGCGFAAGRLSSGVYSINFGFDISNRFYAATPMSACCGTDQAVSHSMETFGTTNLRVYVYLLDDPNTSGTDRPVMIIVY